MLIPTASKIIVNATALVHAFANGMNAFDIPKLQGLLAPGAQYELLPHSLGRPVMPAYDGLAMLAFLKQIVPDFKVSLLDSFHDAQRVKIGVLMFVSVTQAEIKDIDESKDGSKVWAYVSLPLRLCSMRS
jgi:hypothetical protein